MSPSAATAAASVSIAAIEQSAMALRTITGVEESRKNFNSAGSGPTSDGMFPSTLGTSVHTVIAFPPKETAVSLRSRDLTESANVL